MLKTFPKGGLHIPDNKLSEESPIKTIPLPKIVQIPIAQHIGTPPEIIVKRRVRVRTGQLIAKATNMISANIHSPVTGMVMKIDNFTDASGYKKPAIVVKVEEDEWVDGVDTDKSLNENIDYSKEEILSKIKDAGIVGLGGATFPSHVKLNVDNYSTKPELLIINGVECEPYLTADHRLMIEKPKELIVGIKIILKVLGINKAVIGIENNKPDAIDILEKEVKTDPCIEVSALKVKYPQGAEKQLIKAITGKEVPFGKFPIDFGIIVYNVGTVFAIYEAVQKNIPLIKRVVTVTGKSIPDPSNFWVRLGTPVQHLLDMAGGIPEDTGKIINGGPMMGKAVKDFSIPVTKGTSGILLIPQRDSIRGEVQACIRCTKCIDVCPMGLEPYLLMNLTEKVLIDRAKKEDIMMCIECGSCSYICPSNRPLLDYIRLGKAAVKNKLNS